LAQDEVTVTQAAGRLKAGNGRVTLDYDLATGRARLGSTETGDFLEGVRAEARIESGRAAALTAASDEGAAGKRTVSIGPLRSGLGTGTRVTVTHPVSAAVVLRQHFDLYEKQPFLVLSVEARGGGASPLSSRHLAPLVIDAAKGGGGSSVAGPGSRGLFVPFDNDMFVRYGVHWLNTRWTSSEVTALFSAFTRRGIVLGSVTHDQWKTGIAIDAEGDGERLRGLRVFGGLSEDRLTHDTQPHGLVTGGVVVSPRVFVGFYADWRDGMEAYGRANAAVAAPLRWEGGPPFGWNSWAAVGEKVSRDAFVEASDFVARELTPRGFAGRDGVVYLNFDAWWDFLPEAQFQECIAHARRNGQRVGIYWTPFAFWGDDHGAKAEGTNGRYTARDILLKDAQGRPLPKVDNGWPVDPTHPGALARLTWQMDRFVRWGFSYVKLDFLSHGALEGAHHDPAVTTGIAAYNAGMRAVLERLSLARAGRPIFVSLSIAPLFPHQYAHARRVSCDVFGSLKDTEYLLNSVALGWWLSGTAYAFNDPDHVVLYRHGERTPTTDAEALARTNAALIGGGVLLDSDDLRRPGARERARRLLTNRDALALARDGRPFRPVEWDNGYHASEAFARVEPGGKTVHVALFNFRGSAVRKVVPLAALGVDDRRPWRGLDLWTGTVFNVLPRGAAGAPDGGGALSIPLETAGSRLLRLTAQG
jgi:hypothetical protein